MANGYYRRIFKRRAALIEQGTYIIRSTFERKTTFEDYLDRRSKYLLIRPEWKKLPHWATSYVHGYLDGYYREVVDANLEWRVYLDGKHMPGSEVPKGRWPDVVPGMGTSFWKGTNKMFIVPEDMRMKEVNDG